jgi:hypothetical protein
MALANPTELGDDVEIRRNGTWYPAKVGSIRHGGAAVDLVWTDERGQSRYEEDVRVDSPAIRPCERARRLRKPGERMHYAREDGNLVAGTIEKANSDGTSNLWLKAGSTTVLKRGVHPGRGAGQYRLIDPAAAPPSASEVSLMVRHARERGLNPSDSLAVGSFVRSRLRG